MCNERGREEGEIRGDTEIEGCYSTASQEIMLWENLIQEIMKNLKIWDICGWRGTGKWIKWDKNSKFNSSSISAFFLTAEACSSHWTYLQLNI